MMQIEEIDPRHVDQLAPLELGTVFEEIGTTNNTSIPQPLLSQGQSFRGILDDVRLKADPLNANNPNPIIYVGKQGLCKYPLTPNYEVSIRNVSPMNIFFTGNGVAGLILHAVAGGVTSV